MKKEDFYYTDFELLKIVKACNSFHELYDVGLAIVHLAVVGEKINLKIFEAFAHARINEIVKPL